jgi:aspartyl-tRNA(Asn)/glutamyl-tRNA(Gln) amidotransferase subunit A
MSAIADARARLDRIRRLDGELKSFITVDESGALAAAEAADKAAREGRWLGLLHGMTVAVKDNIDTAGLRTTAGSLFFKDHVPNADAPVVERLRRAGASILGKTNLHEFAYGVRSVSRVGGQTLNPWNKERIPGGSSGGSGAALAAGLCAGALGSDTGGSVRLPAAYNGVSGLRPTVGRIPDAGSVPVSATHDTIGPMARSVADVARLFAALAGPEPDDPAWHGRAPLENFLPGLNDGVAGLRIGVPRHHYFDGAEADIADAVMTAARTLERQGAKLDDVSLPGAEEAPRRAFVMIAADAAHFHAERLAQGREMWDGQTWDRMRTGSATSSVDYAASVAAKRVWKRTLAGAFRAIDVLLSPVSPARTPPVADSRDLLEATRAATQNTYPGAFGELPGLAVPCGFGTDGMPIGLQLEAAWGGETTLLRTGAAYQATTDWHRAEPPLD